jgi:hypothetical protein
MGEPIDLDEIAKRPFRYWNQDGLTELFVGFMMFVPACLFRLGNVLPKGSSLVMLLPLAWLAAILAMKWGLKELKERVVSPRGGYVALPTWGRTFIALFVLAAILATVAFIAFPSWPRQWGRTPALALAILFAALFFIGGLQAKSPYMLVLAAVPLLVGVWIYRNSVGFSESTSWVLLAQGVALAFSGAVRFRSFLKANPRVDTAV